MLKRNHSMERETVSQAVLATPTGPRAALQSQGQKPTVSHHDNLLALLVTLHPEASRTCILIASSACVANALAAQCPEVAPRTLIKHFPRESAKLVMVSQRIARSYAGSTLAQLLARFNDELALAKEATLRFAGEENMWSIVKTQNRDALYDLSKVWQTSCTAGLALMQEIEEIFARHDMVNSSSGFSPLRDVLASTGRGEFPLIGSNGLILLPPWAERRQFERAALRWPSHLELHGLDRPVVIRDMSSTGLGLECGFDIAMGSLIVLHVGRDLRLEGTVVWSTDGRAGVELQHPLHTADPAYAFLSSRANVRDRTENGDAHLFSGEARPE